MLSQSENVTHNISSSLGGASSEPLACDLYEWPASPCVARVLVVGGPEISRVEDGPQPSL